MPIKGGWTFAVIPNILEPTGKAFGWLMVDAVIDNIEIKDMKLMPLKSGNLFLPVKASLRKQLGKEAGDKVDVKIYASNKISVKW